MSYEVSVAVQPRRPIAAVAATTTWHRFPGQWRGMLDEVWACLRQAGVRGGCNVMLYHDLPTAGERWEVYGDWHEDPARLQTMVFYSLR
jgi:hypothetical protein